MIPGLVGELGKLDSPLRDLRALVGARDVGVDLVDEDVAEAVERAIETGMTWGAVAEVLLGGAGKFPNRTTVLRTGASGRHGPDCEPPPASELVGETSLEPSRRSKDLARRAPLTRPT